MAAKRALLSWSTGKDAAWSLHVLRQSGEVEVVVLLTTINLAFERVAMHAVRVELLEMQAAAAGLPLLTVGLPWPCSNSEYESALIAALAEAKDRHRLTHAAFGDLFLEDVRAYREQQLIGTGLEPIFPLWSRPTSVLGQEMIEGGLEARVTCVDPRQLDRSFAGRRYDADLLAALPEGVDPCGERGEFHTCAIAGPMFTAPIAVEVGDVVERDGFVFADLLPSRPGPSHARPAAPAIATFDADGALSREFLLDRGFCCGNGCRNCPYP